MPWALYGCQFINAVTNSNFALLHRMCFMPHEADICEHCDVHLYEIFEAKTMPRIYKGPKWRRSVPPQLRIGSIPLTRTVNSLPQGMDAARLPFCIANNKRLCPLPT